MVGSDEKVRMIIFRRQRVETGLIAIVDVEGSGGSP